MLNAHTKKLATQALPSRAYSHAARRHNFHSSIPAVSNALFWYFCFNFYQQSNIPTMDLFLLTITSLSFYWPSLVSSYAPSDTPEPLFTSVLCGCRCLHRYRQILTSRRVDPLTVQTPLLYSPTIGLIRKLFEIVLFQFIWSYPSLPNIHRSIDDVEAYELYSSMRSLNVLAPTY